MKILNSSSQAFLLVLSLAITSSALADASDCSIDSNLIHCGYVNGLDENNNADGRFIKIQVNQSFSYTTCISNTTTFEVSQENVTWFKNAANTALFSICKDGSGTDCAPVGKDSFVLTKNGSQYSANPAIFDLDLSGVAGNKEYATCNVMGTARRVNKIPF